MLLSPKHPYTQGLLGSIPSARSAASALNAIKGAVPNPFRMPPGCKFEPRCPYAWERCQAEPAADDPVGGTGPTGAVLAPDARGEQRAGRAYDAAARQTVPPCSSGPGAVA